MSMWIDCPIHTDIRILDNSKKLDDKHLEQIPYVDQFKDSSVVAQSNVLKRMKNLRSFVTNEEWDADTIDFVTDELSHIRVLCFRSNNIHRLPTAINKFSKQLQQLQLHNLGIREFPDVELDCLRKLSVEGAISALPESIGRCKCLESVHLVSLLRSLPQSFKELKVYANMDLRKILAFVLQLIILYTCINK